LDDNIKDPGAWIASLLIQIMRLSITVIRDTEPIRKFAISLLRHFIPDSITYLLTLVSTKEDNVLAEILNLLASFIGGLKTTKNYIEEE
jgi:hypothetical protein